MHLPSENNGVIKLVMPTVSTFYILFLVTVLFDCFTVKLSY